MEYSELKTTSVEDLLKFIENWISKLDQFRIEMKKDREGALVSELVAIEQMPEAI